MTKHTNFYSATQSLEEESWPIGGSPLLTHQLFFYAQIPNLEQATANNWTAPFLFLFS